MTKAADMPACLAAVRARVSALARVHALLSESGWAAADLGLVVQRELAAYLGEHVTLSGSKFLVRSTAVQPIAMFLHELATNAAKYGALSNPGGRLRVEWRVDFQRLLLCWTELQGSALVAPPTRRGFRSRVIEDTVRTQLGGTIQHHWMPTGLVVEIALPLSRVSERREQARAD